MDWPDIGKLAGRMLLADGYRFEMPTRDEVPALIDFVRTWLPDVSVGGASGYVREEFYREQVCFEDQPHRDVIVLLLKHGAELAGVFSCECNRATMSIYAGMGVAAPRHRGVRLARTGIEFTEALGSRLGMGLAYGMATLKAPHAQRAFERAGWRLIGITPGYDRELVAPGVVKRVYEAVYAKVLVPEAGLLRPRLENMTPRTRAFFHLLYPENSPPNAHAARPMVASDAQQANGPS